MAKLHGYEIVGIYSDESSDTVAFMLDNLCAVVYKYQKDAGVCYGEYRLDEPMLEVVLDRAQVVPHNEGITPTVELKRLSDSEKEK